MLHYVSHIAETLTSLQVAGHAHYLRWQLRFDCCHYEITDLRTLSKQMDHELARWKEHVKSQRRRFYELNYFTAQQLLVLRRELKNGGQIQPHVRALLHSISPHYLSGKLRMTLKTSSTIRMPSQIDAKTSRQQSQEAGFVVQTNEDVDSVYLTLEDLGLALKGSQLGTITI